MADHTGHRRRLKQEYLDRGMNGWPNSRVLEMLLFYAIPQGNVSELAHDLLEQFGSLSGVLDASIEDLKKVKGMGEHSAILLTMIPQVGRAYLSDRADKGVLVRNVGDAVAVLRPYFFGAKNEMVYLLCLDSKGKVLGVRQVAEGSISAAEINTRRLVEEALSLRSAAVYVAHNHVSNLALPSRADWISTDRLRDLLVGVGIVLRDHIIFSDDDAVGLEESSPLARLMEYSIT